MFGNTELLKLIIKLKTEIMKRNKILKALKEAHESGLTLDDIIPIIEGFKEFGKVVEDKQVVYFNYESQELTIGKHKKLGWFVNLGKLSPKVINRIRQHLNKQKTSDQYLLKILEVNPKFKKGFFGIDENLGCLVVGNYMGDMPMSVLYELDNETQLEALRQAQKYAEIELNGIVGNGNNIGKEIYKTVIAGEKLKEGDAVYIKDGLAFKFDQIKFKPWKK